MQEAEGGSRRQARNFIARAHFSRLGFYLRWRVLVGKRLG